jgi:hypothetical protein
VVTAALCRADLERLAARLAELREIAALAAEAGRQQPPPVPVPLHRARRETETEARP